MTSAAKPIDTERFAAGLRARAIDVEGGRVVGAVLDTPSGPYRVRALECVALNTAPTPSADDWPVQAGSGGAALQVALVGRTAARFGRVELLEMV